MAVTKTNRSAFVPGVTGDMRAIAFSDALMHDGELYAASFISAAVVDDGTASMALTIGAEANARVSLQAIMAGAMVTHVYEDAGTTNGTSTDIINLHRASTNTSYVTIAQDPEITTAGTDIYAMQSSGVASAGAILTAGTYVWQVVNVSGTTADVGMTVTLYEMEA